MSSFDRAEIAYERMLMAGPPEPEVLDVPVEFTASIRDGHLDEVIKTLGGTASYTSSVDAEGWREIAGDTMADEVQSLEAAEEVVESLFREHLAQVIDLDTLTVTAEAFEDYEPDWDAILKDRKLEAMGLL